MTTPPASHPTNPVDDVVTALASGADSATATDVEAQTRDLRDRLWQAKLGEAHAERRLASSQASGASAAVPAVQLGDTHADTEDLRAQLASAVHARTVSESQMRELETAVDVLQEHIRHLGRQIEAAYADNRALRESKAMRLGVAVRRVVHPLRSRRSGRVSSTTDAAVPPTLEAEDSQVQQLTSTQQALPETLGLLPEAQALLPEAQALLPEVPDLEELYLSATREGAPWWFPALDAEADISPSDADSLLAQLNSARTSKNGPQPAVAAFRELLVKEGLWDPSLRMAVAEAEAAALITGRRNIDRPGGGDVVIDVRCLQDPAYRTRGVGRHARCVLSEMRSVLAETRLVGLLDPDLPPLGPDAQELLDATASRASDLDIARVSGFVQLSPMTADVGPVAPLLASNRIHCIAIIYDFIPHDRPAAYLRSDSARLSYAARLLALSRYDLGIAISSATSDEAAALLDWSPERLLVSGVADPLASFAVSASATPPADDFILAPTGGDPRKNLLAAVAGFARCKELRQTQMRLVVVGGLSRELTQELESFAEQAKLSAGDVTVLSGVGDTELANLYAFASVVVVPSFCEGFSIPVAEGVLRGTPVVASDIPAHRELLGDGWWLVPPTDIEAIGRAMLRAALAPGDMSTEQCTSISNLASPAAVRERLRAVFERLKGEDDSSPAPPVLLRPAKPKLAILSPFPPQHSGVADYTAFTARYLAEHADVTIFSETKDAKPPTGVHVEPLSAQPYLDRSFDAVLSVIGNSHFHIPMIEYLQQYGGACIAHDNRMLDLYAWWKGNDATARLLSRADRPIFGEEIPGFLADLDTLPDLAFGDIVRWADPLIVHAHGLAARLHEERGVTPIVVPFVPYNLPPSRGIGTREQARRQVGFTEGRCHVATFGHVDIRYKGVDLVLAAAGWCKMWGLNLELHFVGSVPEHTRLQLLGAAREVGMDGRLHMHGRVDPGTLSTMLAAVDAAVQLRTSSVLSLSGALADCIAFGIPTVATEELAIEMSAPAFVRAVSSKATPLIVAEAIAEVVADGRSDSLEQQRVMYLKERSGEAYAAGLMSALGLGPER